MTGNFIVNNDKPLPAGTTAALEAVIRIMARLRAPDGCPWDRDQDHQSLRKNLLEETHEVIHAINSADDSALCEELGDLLLQVIFHAQIAEETGRFDLKDVAEGLADKLIRRHPHVFGDNKANNAREALDSWNQAKRTEGEHTVRLDQIPAAMPGLLRARKVAQRAAKVGFEWPDVSGALRKLDEEIVELKDAIASGDKACIEDELGDAAFMLACVASYVDQCPEIALHGTIEKFMRRFRYVEERLAEEGLTPEQATLEQMDVHCDRAKEDEKGDK